MGKSKKNIVRKDNKNQWYYLIPILFVVAIVPLIVFAKVDAIEGIRRTFWKGSKTSIDFFSYYKGIFLIISATIGLLLLGANKLYNSSELKKTRYYIPMIVYVLFVILSTLFAEHKEVALYGFLERYEGMYVLLSYIAVMFLTINLVNDERDSKIVLGGLFISAAIIGFLGVSQFLGYDFLRTDIGKRLMLPKNLHHIVNSLNFSFGKNSIYATMYNTNYVGSYAAMLLPISVSLIGYFKNIAMKMTSVLFSVLMIILLLGSKSRAGYIGAAFAIIILLIILGRYLLSHIKVLSIVFICFIITIVGIDKVSDGLIIREIKRLDLSNEMKVNEGIRFENIVVEGNFAIIETNKETLALNLDNNRLRFLDEEGNELKFNQKNTRITIEDERYKKYSFDIPENESMIKARIHGKEILLFYSVNGFKPIGNGGRVAEIEYPETYGFEGRERFASGRGYIWSRTIPMLKDTVFVGYGPDTYPIYFPQMDFAGKLNAFRQATMLTDKPHNMYLQIGVNTGVISLLAVLALFGMYFVQSFKIYITRKIETFEEFAGIGIFTAFCGYAVAGLFNDSLVSVAPVFWVLLGMGISINLRLNKKENVA